MKYLIYPTEGKTATHTKADNSSVMVYELQPTSQISGPIAPVEADSLSALETAQGLTPIPKTVPASLTQAGCIDLAQKTITDAFPVLVLLDGQNKIFKNSQTGTLSSIPKTVAVAEWVETVKQIALAGSTVFPVAPYSVADVLGE